MHGVFIPFRENLQGEPSFWYFGLLFTAILPDLNGVNTPCYLLNLIFKKEFRGRLNFGYFID